jgi:putative DNA primase/helicase
MDDRPPTTDDGRSGAEVIDLTSRIEERKRGGGGGGTKGGGRGGPPSRKLLPEEKLRYTDLGNAERLVLWYGNDLRFVEEWGQWLVWDGRRWVLDRQGIRVKELACEVTRRLMNDASKRLRDLRKEEAPRTTEEVADREKVILREEAMVKWATTCQTGGHVSRMIDFASAQAEMRISFKKLNQKPHLLNCKNGTLDLDTGQLRKHSRSDYLTQITEINYKPDAECPLWWWFIDHAMGGNKRLMRYLQRVAGYSASGHVKEFAVFFHFGNGGRGKSTFLITLKHVLGEYAAKAPRFLLFKTVAPRHETELTVLYGRRMVFCAEVEENQKLDEGLVKDITSADPISGRRMREDHWEFPPTHKGHVGCNYKPRIDGSDDGIWRRVHLIPWNFKLGPEHKDILAKLQLEEEGILAWMVRGHLRWKKHGLMPPEEVLQATQQYREESDSVGEFLRACCAFGVERWVSNEKLRDTYERYCQENGVHPMSAKRFNARLRGFDHKVDGLELLENAWVSRNQRGWRGVGVNKKEKRDG